MFPDEKATIILSLFRKHQAVVDPKNKMTVDPSASDVYPHSAVVE